MKRISIIALATVTMLPVGAQKDWTLTECIEHAVAHNITVKERENQVRKQEVQLSTARNQRIPDLNASAGQNFSFGRGLTADNTYANKSTSSTSFSLGTSVPLFTGFRIPNTVKLNQLNLQAATANLENAKNNIRVQVAQAYVQILYNMEIRDVAYRQVTIDSAQTERIRALMNVGKASQAQLSQQEATLAQSRLTATQAENNTQLALLTLSQLLELSSPENFNIVRPATRQDLQTTVIATPEEIFAEAVTIRPEVEVEKLRLQMAEKSISVAQADYYPQLSLSAGLGSNYYKTSGLRADAFSSQMKNNFNQYIGLSLSVPIFNRFQTRNSVRSARIDYQTQKLTLDNTKKQLYKEVQQAYYNTVAAQQKLKSSETARKSADAAFKLTTAKYEQGKANITEFNEAKNTYLKTESDLTQARYEFLYQTALLQFYRGKDFCSFLITFLTELSIF